MTDSTTPGTARAAPTDLRAAPPPPVARGEVRVPPAPPRQRWRLYLAIPAAATPAELGPGVRGWAAALPASGLPLALDAAGHGRVVPASTLPLGISGEREVVDILLVRPLRIADVRAALRSTLPPAWDLVDLHDVWVGAPGAPAAVVAADYRCVVTGSPRWAVEGATHALLDAAELPRERRREKKITGYDLRPLVLELEVRGAYAASVTLGMRLRHGSDAIGRPDEVLAALDELRGPGGAGALATRAIVRERFVMVDDPGAPSRGPSPQAGPVGLVGLSDAADPRSPAGRGGRTRGR